MWFACIPSCSLLTFLMVLFAVTEVFNIDEIQFIFSFVTFDFGIITNKPLSNLSCSSYIVVWSTWHVYSVTWSFNFIVLDTDKQFSHHHLLKRLIPIELTWYPYWKPSASKCKGLFLVFNFYFIYLYIIMSGPHSLYYCSFVVKFKIWKYKYSSWVLLHDCWTFSFHMKFRIILSAAIKKYGILIGITFNLQISLWSIAMFTIFPVH